MEERSPTKRSRHLRFPRIGLLVVYPTLLLGVLYVTIFLIANSPRVRPLLEGAINSFTPGEEHFAEIRIMPNLVDIEVYGYSLISPTGLVLAEVDEAYINADLGSLLQGIVAVNSVHLVHPRVILSFDAKGEFEFYHALTTSETWHPDTPWSPDPDLRFEGIHVSEAEVLLNYESFSIALDRLTISNAYFELRPSGHMFIQADISASAGRFVAMPELFGRVDVRQTASLHEYRRHRRADPWDAIQNPPRDGSPDAPAPLVISLDRLHAEGAEYEDDVVRVETLMLALQGMALEVSGELVILEEKREELGYDVEGELTLDVADGLLPYILPDIITSLSGEGVEATPGAVTVRFDILGDLTQIAGDLAVAADSVSLGGLDFAQIGVSASTESGGPFNLHAEGGLDVMTTSGAEVAGTGFYNPSDGRYGLELWISALTTELFLGDDDTLHATIETQPPHIDLNAAAPLHVSGNLDDKYFLELERARLDDEGRPGLAHARMNALVVRTRDGSELPFEQATLEGRLDLSTDGIVTLTGLSVQSPLRVEVDRDWVEIAGVVDLLTGRYLELEVEARARSIAAYVAGGELDANVRVHATLAGSFTAPDAAVHELHVQNLNVPGLAIASIRTAVDISFDDEGRPRASGGDLHMLGLEAEGVQVSRLSTSYSLDGDWLSVRNLDVSSSYGDGEVPRGRVRLFRGDMTPLSDPELDLTVLAEDLEIGELVPDQPVAGIASVEVQVSGRASNPRVQGTAALADASVYDEWVTAAEIDFSFRDGELEVTDFEVQTPDGSVGGALAFGAGGVGRSRLLVEGIMLENLAMLRSLGIPIGGRPRIDLEIIPPDEVERHPWLPEAALPAEGFPDVQGSIVIDELRFFGVDQGVIALSVDTYGEAVQAVGLVGRDLDTRITIPFDMQDMQANLRFSSLPLHEILPSIGESADSLVLHDGVLNVDVSLDPMGIFADLSIDQIEMDVGGATFGTPRPVHITYTLRSPTEPDQSEHRIHIPELAFGSEGQFLSIRGEILDFETLNLHVRGDTALSLAAFFTTAIAEASGIVSVQLDVLGTIDSPMPTGSITVAEASVSVPGLGDEIGLSEGTIELKPYWYDPSEENHQTVEIQSLIGSLFGGAFDLSGYLHLDQFSPTDLEIQLLADSLRYLVPGMLTVDVNRLDMNLFSYDLSLEDSFILSGNVTLQELVYFADIGGTEGLFSRDEELDTYSLPIYEEIPQLAKMRLDIGVFAPDSIYVRNTITIAGFDAALDLEARADLQVRGSLPELALEGSVEITRGEVFFQNTTYTIDECRISFDRDHPITQPFIECQAEAQFERNSDARVSSSALDELDTLDTDRTRQPYIVIVSVSGRPGDEDFSPDLMATNAALDRRDIVSLILTGRTLDEATLTATQGIDILFRELVSVLEENLSRDINLEIVTSTGGGTTIRFSPQLSDNLTLDAEASILGGNDSQQITLNSILNETMSLELSGRNSQENELEFGARLRFHVELD